MSERVKVGMVGCGAISGIYFKQLKEVFKNVELVAVADLDVERAKQKAAENGIAKACSVDELIADPEIQVVLNLTVPKAHAPVSIAAVNAGKSAYSEKPFTVTRAEGKALLAAADKNRVLVGSAPDTFLGGGIQTCRKLIDDGWIGTPIGASAFMTCPGHESWHPSPEFYYEVGGGPMFDMGPYYLTALINLLGPVARISGSARITRPTRTITSAPKYGKVVTVETPTHVAGTMDFASGAVGTIITSFDVHHAVLPRIEIYGTAGTLSVPDPNGFGGPVKLARAGQGWVEMPLSHGYADNARGIGVADLAKALVTGREHRANGKLAYHVLDCMQSFLDASDLGKAIMLESTCERPAPLPMGLRNGELD